MAGERILIVEDENLLAKELCHKLMRMGYTIAGVVATGEEALQGVQKEPPDLVLMDIHLAGAMDGIETATQIFTHFNIPVIYLTAYSDHETIQRVKSSQSFGYILKPLRQRELETNIEIALYKYRIEAELQGANRQLAREITERQQTEEALRQAKEAAEEARQVAEAAQKASEEAHKVKSEFLANMSHELRTPLTAIMGFTQLVEHETLLSEYAREHIRIIRHSGEHLLMLINDVLDMSKIEAGRITTNPRQFELCKMLATIEEMMRIRADSKGLRFSVTCEPEVPCHIIADESKLRRVLINLLNNAIKFTDEGSVSLRVAELDEFNESGNSPTQKLKNSKTQKLLFEISDTGPGIAPEELDEIFRAFERGRNHADIEGTGLGLTISQKFVRIMGGALKVDSQVGRGSVFTVTIPIEIAASSSGENQQSVSLPSGASPSHTLPSSRSLSNALESLPTGVLQELESAIAQLDSTKILRVIDAIRRYDDGIANAVLQFTDAFRYREVLNALQSLNDIDKKMANGE